MCMARGRARQTSTARRAPHALAASSCTTRCPELEAGYFWRRPVTREHASESSNTSCKTRRSPASVYPGVAASMTLAATDGARASTYEGERGRFSAASHGAKGASERSGTRRGASHRSGGARKRIGRNRACGSPKRHSTPPLEQWSQRPSKGGAKRRVRSAQRAFFFSQRTLTGVRALLRALCESRG